MNQEVPVLDRPFSSSSVSYTCFLRVMAVTKLSRATANLLRRGYLMGNIGINVITVNTHDNALS